MEPNHEKTSVRNGATTGETKPELQIVGGGLAGLLAANLAVRAGLSVRLIEQNTTVGGRARTDQHHRYNLNVGPHALYRDGELRRALSGLGLRPAGFVPPARDASGSLAGRVGPLPAGPWSLLRTPLLSAKAKATLGPLMARLPRLDPADYAAISVDEWLAAVAKDDDLRTFLHGLITVVTYNAGNDVASADAAIGQLQMVLGSGVEYLDHGWGSFIESLDRSLDGAVERVEAKVVAVEAAGADRSISTVARTADGRTLQAATCLVAAGGPAVVDRLLDLDQPLASQIGEPVQVSVLDLGLRAAPERPVHFALGRRLYGSCHSVAAGLAPADRHLVTLALYRTTTDDSASPEETKALLLTHADAMGIDRSTIDMERYLHRLTVAWGAPQATAGGLAGRPGVAVADRPGVYVAGDWVGPQGLLGDAVAASVTDAVTEIGRLMRTTNSSATLVRS